MAHSQPGPISQMNWRSAFEDRLLVFDKKILALVEKFHRCPSKIFAVAWNFCVHLWFELCVG